MPRHNRARDSPSASDAPDANHRECHEGNNRESTLGPQPAADVPLPAGMQRSATRSALRRPR
jgi:hypothetical protein